jgi:hypothetical protein
MEKKAPETRVDREGIRTTERRRSAALRYAVAVAAVAAIAAPAVVAFRDEAAAPEPTLAAPAQEKAPVRVAEGRSPRPVARHAEARTRVAEEPAAAMAAAPTARELLQQVPRDLSQEPARAVSDEQARDAIGLAQEMLDIARAEGETRGIAAFPPPGTNPIKLGLVVPKSFELPEGYVRHYQLTDDGRRLEPILMFSPDYEFVDAQGQPYTPPADGIVPEEMAPAGLPLRMLPMPKHPYGASLGGN